MAQPASKLTLAYHGGRFSGWAAQPGRRTVEGELAAAVEAISGERVAIEVAGRTDAGVHAWRQVASFSPGRDIEPKRLIRALNAVLAPDVQVVAAEHAPPGFSARRDARSRTYCYRVAAAAHRSPFERGLSLWWPYPCDTDVLADCAALLAGPHDFTAFTPTRSDHVRFERQVLGAEWRVPRSLGSADQAAAVPAAVVLELWIEADGFLRHMVRVLVGTMLGAAAGSRSVDGFSRLLEGAPRSAAGPTAPAHGLFLAGVTY